MGSGTCLAIAYKKYGKENFTKDIQKYFDTIEEAYAYEKIIVNNNLVKNNNCYNIVEGGGGINTSNMVVVKDKNNKTYLVSKDDIRYINKELIPIRTNKVLVVDKNG